MSLDFYLEGDEIGRACECECGNKHEHRYKPTLFDINITHNLGGMADKAGTYLPLWRPSQFVNPEAHEQIEALERAGKWHDATPIRESLRPAKARELIDALTKGLADLKARPAYFEQFNAPNGWGLYRHFVPFVEKCLAACIEHPDADVRASV